MDRRKLTIEAVDEIAAYSGESPELIWKKSISEVVKLLQSLPRRNRKALVADDPRTLREGVERRKRPGRPKAEDITVEREAILAANWERARDAGTYKPDFAKDNRMTVKELNALLDRVRSRHRPKRKSTSE